MFDIGDNVQWNELGTANHGCHVDGLMVVEQINLDTENEIVFVLSGYDYEGHPLTFAATGDELIYAGGAYE